jgi:hypothetical protein
LRAIDAPQGASFLLRYSPMACAILRHYPVPPGKVRAAKVQNHQRSSPRRSL